MTTLHDQLAARVDRFGDLPWPDSMSYRQHETARADLYQAALFHLLGALTAMTDPTHPAPTKTGITRAVTVSLDRAQPETAHPHEITAPAGRNDSEGHEHMVKKQAATPDIPQTVTVFDEDGAPVVRVQVGDEGSARAVASTYLNRGQTVEITRSGR